MIHYFPTPYPDEWWYSILCRYHIRSGNLVQTTIKELFQGEEHAQIATTFPNRTIYRIHQQLPKGVLNLDDLILNHTIFNYLLRIRPYEKKKEILNILKSGNEPPTNTWKTIHPMKSSVKWCPVCIEEDTKTYGESYWHISHQIPMATICTKHRCRLNTYIPSYRTGLQASFIKERELKENSQMSIDNRISEEEIQLNLLLESYLKEPMSVSPPKEHNNLIIGLANAGYCKLRMGSATSISAAQLYDDLIDYYGKEFVQTYFGNKIDSYILNRMNSWKMISPERYVILGSFINQPISETFSHIKIKNLLHEKVKALEKYGELYTRKEIAEQIGINPLQLSEVVEELQIDPFWYNERVEKKRPFSIKTHFTKDEIDLIDKEMKKIGMIKNRAAFVRYCIIKAISDS